MSNEEDFDALSKDDEELGEKSSRKKSKKDDDDEEDGDAGGDDDSDDGDAEGDEDDEDEDDEEEEEGRPRKRARTSDLLDIEAEASDDEDEEEPEFDEEEMKDFVVGEGDEDIDETATMHRALDRGRDKATEKLVEQLQQRHARYVQTPDMDQEDFERSNIRQQARQPTLKDPRLFSVKCKPGMERELCAKLLNKFFHLKKEEDGSDSRIKVYSIVTMDHLKGYIYIEADKVETARDFVMYINGIWASKIELVKLNEMVPTMTITKKKTTLKRGDWVRLRRSVYANDLAQVTEYDPANERVMVKHVPRIDLDAWSKRESTAMDMEEEEGKGNKRKRATAAKATRPPPRLFNPEEVRARGGVVERTRDEATGEIYETFEKQRFREGFLYRQLKLPAVIINPPPPDLLELQRFQAAGAPRVGGGEGGDEELEAGPNISLQFKAVNELQKKRQVVFQRDDKVLVVEGELKNLVGRVVEIKGEEIRVQPLFDVVNEQPLALPVIPLAAHQLRKHFSNGAHVKVVAGEHSGETGIVVKISDNVATLISDLTMTELRVLSSDLVATAEISTGAKIGDYSLYDLVNLSATEIGVIVRIEGDKVVVLDPNSGTRDVRLQALSRRRDTRAVVGKGHDGKPVGAGDKVRILSGPYRDSTGVIKHVHRANAFVHLKDRAQNSGLVVVRNKSLVVAGEANNAQRRDVFGKTMTAVAPRSNTKGRGKQNDPLLHKQVTITRGPWKGYQGLVKDATDKDVIVELASNAKRVSIAKEAVRLLDAINRGPAPDHFGDWDPTKTPLRGDQTPLRVATPGRPMTPSHDPFNPLATATPFRDSLPDMRTPVGFERRVQTPLPSTPSALPYSTPTPQTPAPLYTPSTPNAAPYSTPSLPLQTPLTSLPRTMPTPLTAATPGTPGAASLPPRTPQGPVSYTTPMPYSPAPLTPGSVHGYVETPKTPTEQPYGYTPSPFIPTPTTPTTQSLTTPMTALPQTPGSQYQEPSTPYALPPDTEPENDTLKLFSQVLVKIDASFRASLGGKVATVREAKGDTVVVTVVDSNEQVSVPFTMLAVVTPEKRDSVMIVRGQFAGSKGMLIGIDMPDGIVKMETTGEIKILKLSYLAKCSK